MNMLRALNLWIPDTIDECEHGLIDLHLGGDDKEKDDSISRSCFIQLGVNGGWRRYKRMERTNAFINNLASKTTIFRDGLAKRVKSLVLNPALSLDNWEPLLTALQQQQQQQNSDDDNNNNNTGVEQLELKCCHLTERGALLLGQQVLNSNNNKNNIFPIKTLRLLSLSGSTAWIHGLVQNQTIKNLHLHRMPVLYSAIRFIQTFPRLKRAELYELTTSPQEEEATMITANDFFPQNDENPILDLETLDISFHEEETFPSNLCYGIGRILCRAKQLQHLKLENVDRHLSYDFLNDAIHCHKLQLRESDFDPKTLLFLVQEGNLKDLQLYFPRDVSNVERLLQVVNLSLLDSFEIDWYCQSSHDDQDDYCVDYFGWMNLLCRQLADNKGPKHLKIWVENADLSELLENTKLTSSLIGNDQIERLEIIVTTMKQRNFEPQRELLLAMGKMPRLHSWRIHVNGPLLTLLSSGSDEQDNNADNLEQEWNTWILFQLESNGNIHNIDPPFQAEKDVEEMLIFNKHWRSLFYCHDKLSSGIWSRALSQIETVGLMFRILGQIPSLFQQVSDAASQQEPYQLPCFSVPHHFHCPACHEQKQSMQT